MAIIGHKRRRAIAHHHRTVRITVVMSQPTVHYRRTNEISRWTARAQMISVNLPTAKLSMAKPPI